MSFLIRPSLKAPWVFASEDVTTLAADVAPSIFVSFVEVEVSEMPSEDDP